MKILSIDFDTIMFPCIKLYNDYCMGNANDTQIWNQLEFERDISQYLKYDANAYHNIVKLILLAVKNGAKFIPIQEHQFIVDYLKNYHLIDHAFEITNIDYHHDILYHKESLISMDFDQCSCADWAGYLLNKNENTSLTWIRCPGSAPYNFDLKSFENEIIVKNLDSILELDSDYDLVFFCLSPQWVPYIYHHLYNLVIEIIQLSYPDQINYDLKPPAGSLIPIAVPVLVYKDAETGEEITIEDNASCEGG